MENRIIYITKDEAETIKKNTLQKRDTFFVEINGAEIKTEEEYVQAMATGFALPHELPTMKIEWLNDYICDLIWIEQKKIVMIIHEYSLMLIDDLKTKKEMIADFEEIILPWWEGKIIGHMVGGEPKSFLIYLEDIG